MQDKIPDRPTEGRLFSINPKLGRDISASIASMFEYGDGNEKFALLASECYSAIGYGGLLLFSSRNNDTDPMLTSMLHVVPGTNGVPEVSYFTCFKHADISPTDLFGVSLLENGIAQGVEDDLFYNPSRMEQAAIDLVLDSYRETHIFAGSLPDLEVMNGEIDRYFQSSLDFINDIDFPKLQKRIPSGINIDQLISQNLSSFNSQYYHIIPSYRPGDFEVMIPVLSHGEHVLTSILILSINNSNPVFPFFYQSALWYQMPFFPYDRNKQKLGRFGIDFDFEPSIIKAGVGEISLVSIVNSLLQAVGRDDEVIEDDPDDPFLTPVEF